MGEDRRVSADSCRHQDHSTTVAQFWIVRLEAGGDPVVSTFRVQLVGVPIEMLACTSCERCPFKKLDEPQVTTIVSARKLRSGTSWDTLTMASVHASSC